MYITLRSYISQRAVIWYR